MYAQPLGTADLANARIADLRRQSARRRPASVGTVERRTTIHAPLPVRRRAGWWLVTVGLRLAVGSPNVAR